MEGTIESTDSIRALAPRWSLAGDDKLLNLLQSTHQRIVSQCQEVNTKLVAMASALDEASINLQNVNNKFMALSNSQFIESRVYDDEADVTTDILPCQEPPKPEPVDEVAVLRRGLATLEGAHETAQILDDSDDSDDSEAQISVVLKPRDMYSTRPLPYIIGSHAWKSKWHAGLVIEDSDTDSSTSRHDVRELEQYSESEEDIRTDKQIRDTTISESSSSFHSERERERDISSVPEKRQTPADVAAELAARLGRAAPRVVEEPEESLPSKPIATVYRPQKPVSSTMFWDEPPPIDTNEHFSSESQDEDIFAEINRRLPNKDTAQSKLNDDLFGRTVPDFTESKVEAKSAKQKATLFDDESEPELFGEKPPTIPKENIQSKVVEEISTKKPVGGKSLFGSNKGTENIGAAILKRNRRKSSASEHETDENSPKTKNTIINEPVAARRSNIEERDSNKSNANDIFDNLFAKAKQAEQKLVKPAKFDRSVKEKVKPKPKEVKDLFSDSIFDDIDDIFTSNIKIPTKEANKNAKSIFDDDDDDLFSGIAQTKPKDTKAISSSSNKKSIFDSDDDLFSDVKVTKNELSTKNNTSENEKTQKAVRTESHIDESSITSKSNFTINNNNTIEITERAEIDEKTKKKYDSPKKQVKPKAKLKSIFDSDSDDGLFSDVTVKTTKQPINKDLDTNMNSRNIDFEAETDLFKERKDPKIPADSLNTEKTNLLNSPSLFEEEEIDDLYINANQAKKNACSTPINTDIEQIVPGFQNKHKIPEEKHDFKSDERRVNVPNKYDENIDKAVETRKSDTTKPYIFPRNDKSETKSGQFTNPKETDTTKAKESPINLKDDFIESSQEANEPMKVQTRSISTDDTVKPKPKEPASKVFSSDHNEKKNVECDNDILLPNSQESIFFEKDSEILHKEELNDPMFDSNMPLKEKQDVIPEQNQTIPLAAAFDDIFSEPPAFEKDKETKKATNVNALFEDDSDDEALFFKKDDVISDEKPEIFTPSADFGIFNDEPPDLDVDFTPTASKSYNSDDDDDDDDLFSSAPKNKVNATGNILNEPPEIGERASGPKNNTPFSETTEKPTQILFTDDNLTPEITKFETKAPIKENHDFDGELYSNIPLEDPVPESSHKENTISKPKSRVKEESTDQVDEIIKRNEILKESDTKKIGKLNTKNININVQALVPGASPKKTPKERAGEETTNVVHNFENKDKLNVESEPSNKDEERSTTEVENAEPIAVKSICFESKPESGVLDNNLSKQRPRIQVKRRPSSRRARHEAVRKSVIGIDDDTDNSSSFDEPKPSTFNENQISNEKESNEHKNNNEKIRTISDKISKDKSIVHNTVVEKASEHQADNLKKVFNEGAVDRTMKSDELSWKDETFNIHNEIAKHTSIKSTVDEVDSKLYPSNAKILNEDFTQKLDLSESHNEENIQKSPQSTTKVVYILNDEDIFSNNSEKPYQNTVKDDFLTNTKEIVDEDDDIFKTKGIKTIGNTYKTVNTTVEPTTTNKDTTESYSKSPKNIQATTNTESIEKDKEPSKKVQPTKKKAKSLFDLSDDDDDLFGKTTKTKKVETKCKLFESDSEDDLFSGKKGKDKIVIEERVKEVKKERVKEVKKGSLFGDDDDDDLFGVKTKGPVTESLKVSTSKETTKSTEVVFDDPLSMLEDD